MPYLQLHYHLVWTTLNREPWIQPEVEEAVHRFLWEKALELDARVFAVNGTADHVHMVVSIPPKIAVARLVGQVKASSSARINRAPWMAHRFRWQSEYGAFTIGRKQLNKVVEYVKRQKQHHAAGTTIPILERDQETSTAGQADGRR
ncbi:MAG: IS200/IS605 family transposase [Acidobacteriota bacterium]|nr:IS200/IS605 family transposase [Acidobacteriota bacterium]